MNFNNGLLSTVTMAAAFACVSCTTPGQDWSLRPSAETSTVLCREIPKVSFTNASVEQLVTSMDTLVRQYSSNKFRVRASKSAHNDGIHATFGHSNDSLLNLLYYVGELTSTWPVFYKDEIVFMPHTGGEGSASFEIRGTCKDAETQRGLTALTVTAICTNWTPHPRYTLETNTWTVSVSRSGYFEHKIMILTSFTDVIADEDKYLTSTHPVAQKLKLMFSAEGFERKDVGVFVDEKTAFVELHIALQKRGKEAVP